MTTTEAATSQAVPSQAAPTAEAAAESTTSFAHGLVIGKFYPVHVGHLNLIRSALARCERVSVQVLYSSQESVAAEVRAQWLREEVPGAHIMTGLDDARMDYTSAAVWDEHVTIMKDLLAGAGPLPAVDAVFTSDAYGAELARRFDATWVQVDPGRVVVAAAGRAIRTDPGAHWWALPAGVRSWFARRVVVLGAESTGTTTLAEDLQRHYGLPPVPEYGRTWSEIRPGGLSAPWLTSEFDLVAREQARLEDDAARITPRPLLVCDTDPLATVLWHERYVGSHSPSVAALAATRVPDLYLLTGDEIPFVQDGMRDGEHIRHAMQDRFRQTLAAQQPGGAPWVELRGSRADRLAQAIVLIDELVASARPMADPLPVHGEIPG